MPLPIVVLISGNGSNLQAIIDAIQTGLAINICCVISNCPDAYGLARAEQAGIPAQVINHQDYATRDEFENELRRVIDNYQPKLIVLAGFMRRLGKGFVQHYQGRMINIHPSLLPKYPGLHTHRRALAANDKEHGVSIHFVTEEVDGGPIICQAKLLIRPDDSEETLKTRIQQLEHQLYPKVLDWFANDRMSLCDHMVWLDGKPLQKNGKLLLNSST